MTYSRRHDRMYAIFEAKGKQWRAEEGATLQLPSLDAEPGTR